MTMDAKHCGMVRTLLAVFLLALGAGTALAGFDEADDRTGRWGLGFEMGLMKLTGGDWDYSNIDQFAAIHLDRRFSEKWNLQFAFRYGHVRPGVGRPGLDAGWTTDSGAALYTVMTQPAIRLQRIFSPAASLSPRLGAGVGLTSWKVLDKTGEDVGAFPGGDPTVGYDTEGNQVELKGTELTITAAAGLDWTLGENWSLDLGGRFHWFPNADRDNVGLSSFWGPEHVDANTFNVEGFLGFTYWFGSNDSDGDGVPNAYDACPDVAEDIDGFKDNDGCPDPDNDGDGVADVDDACPDQPEDRDGFEDSDGCPEPDNDGDGVADGRDGCPEEPEDRDGFEDDDGCPDPDNDGDGVPDEGDKCPDTAADTEVDGDGCAVLVVAPPVTGLALTAAALPVPGQTTVLHDITFTTASARLTPASDASLDALAEALVARPEAMVEVRGHTDSTGDAEANRELSARRATAVRDALVRRGVAPGQVRAVGYGEDIPRATNETRAGRAVNRRVELHRIR